MIYDNDIETESDCYADSKIENTSRTGPQYNGFKDLTDIFKSLKETLYRDLTEAQLENSNADQHQKLHDLWMKNRYMFVIDINDLNHGASFINMKYEQQINTYLSTNI